MNDTMGNQQETICGIELGWLAGILDGEGSIGITQVLSHRKNPTLVARISIGNTNIKIINQISKILKKIRVVKFIQKKQQISKKNPKWKDVYIIQISNILGAKKLLDVVTPFLIGKKLQAEILLSFIDSRLKIYKELNRVPGSGGQGTPYTKEELEFCKQLSDLNKKGTNSSSETTCQSPKKGEDIVRTI